MRAVITDPGNSPRLRIAEVKTPTSASNATLVRVEAFSMNAGETRTALASDEVYTPGWDFAGVVEQAAPDGSGFKAGTRVFGFTLAGAWAEYVAVGQTLLAEIPAGVTSVQAASLPVAGITAMLSLELAGSLLGRRVLVTGAAGGVGRFACQLAALSGAKVYAISRRLEFAALLLSDGVKAERVFQDMEAAKAGAEYDVILDSVGGETLAVALTSLANGGVCVNCGNSANAKSSFDVREFYRRGDVRLHGVFLGTVIGRRNCSPLLAQLAGLVAGGHLISPVGLVMPWSTIDDAAKRLIAQSVNGKIVLTIN